ncbi:hypothetical protein AVEN_167236-1 [Araneus ventricosus]|uniref:Uncharacterized protein n=1 Tax=Araneus ventricosus TaxID=182803 RepID=A0A4Y2NCH1_ARAVE|nr:hypothetical protein AVEN_167236-1 [Araneus ventricosus]
MSQAVIPELLTKPLSPYLPFPLFGNSNNWFGVHSPRGHGSFFLAMLEMDWQFVRMTSRFDATRWPFLYIWSDNEDDS